VLELLHALKARHHWLAVATGKSRAGLDEALLSVELKGVFDGTRTADETRSKPDPQMLQRADARVRRRAPDRTLMIGDTTHDLQLAANAGTPSVAVAYGAHQTSEFDPRIRRCSSRRPWQGSRRGCRHMPEAAPDGALALCAGAELAEAGTAHVFDVMLWRRPARAFALRFEGRVVAYLNRCAHVPTEMDWRPGEFLDDRTPLHRVFDARRGLRAHQRALHRRARARASA
jgi:nitrite reductase/ring-hydroxylating ferredoxin subunit